MGWIIRYQTKIFVVSYSVFQGTERGFTTYQVSSLYRTPAVPMINLKSMPIEQVEQERGTCRSFSTV